jgi:hypothetical protein
VVVDTDRRRAALAQRRARRSIRSASSTITAGLFPAQRSFYAASSRLRAALCSRRAGKTYGGNAAFLDRASRTPHGRLLYINASRAECKRLAWYGNRGDGMAMLIEQHKLPAVTNLSELTIHFPAVDSWIYMIGADDERGVSRALGGGYHEVWWDEAQKIPTKLTPAITEVLMPTLLDSKGTFTLTGTADRRMSGLFYEVTRPELEKRRRGWDVRTWTMLDNPWFGRVQIEPDGRFSVVARAGDRHAGPFRSQAEAEAAVAGVRMQEGPLELQQLLSVGPEIIPLDSPIMQRAAFARWTAEDANFVYHVHRIARKRLLYAPARRLPNGLPDIRAALADLPGGKEAWRDYHFALGADIGYSPDPFAIVLWAWGAAGGDKLYEVASWQNTEMTSDEQAAYLQSVIDLVHVSVLVADAGGPAKSTVQGWSKGYKERYPLPVEEAKKDNKDTWIHIMNADIVSGRIQLREDGALIAEMDELQWSVLLTATGRMIEDPSQSNHCCDGGLYAFRHTYHFRHRPPPPPPLEAGSPQQMLQEEAALEDAADDGEELEAA